MIECKGGCRAAAPKGSMTYAFTHMRNFLLLLLLLLLSLRASRMGFGPWDGDLGLETGGGWTDGRTEEKEKEKEEEKIPHMCESIGHRPLRGRCPKTRPYTRLPKSRAGGQEQ